MLVGLAEIVGEAVEDCVCGEAPLCLIGLGVGVVFALPLCLIGGGPAGVGLVGSTAVVSAHTMRVSLYQFTFFEGDAWL